MPLQIGTLQIKDENDDVINLSWMVGPIQPQQSIDVSQSWIRPKKEIIKL